jgi:hypothetical protein
VAPDASADRSPRDAGTALAGEGVDFAVLLADDTVPTVDIDVHDDVLAVAASRADGEAWSWPWSPNSRRPAYGAVPWEGLGAGDLLAALEGGESNARLTVVDAGWVDRARTEASPLDWDPRPDALWLDDLDDLPTYLGLLADWVDIAPLGPRTWIGIDAARNVAAAEAGIVDGRTTAGTGPRLTVTRGSHYPGGWQVRVNVDAARWMAMRAVSVWTDAGEVVLPVDGSGAVTTRVPDGTTWVVAVATGDHAAPWSADPAWAVSAPLWIAAP